MSNLNERDKNVLCPSVWLWIPQCKIVGQYLATPLEGG